MDPAWLINVMEVEEEERVYHLKLERAMLRDRSDPFRLPDKEFKRLFRLNKEMFQNLVIHLSPYMSQGERSTKIPINMRILATLRFFAQGSYQRCVGSNFYNCMGQQTFSETLSEVCRAFERIAPLWVRFPTTIEEQRNIKMEFMLNNGFPGVIGCIDGTHVAILCPAVDEHLYFNRKRYHSKNVQIICDRSLRILNINANYPGATHDAFIWQNSNINDWFRDEYYEGNNRNSWLLGDSGYPIQPWLLTPVQGALPGTADARYNDAHSRARNCVERCIGLLKMRFRCLLKERVLRYKPFKVGQIINACCVLHNMCIAGNIDIEGEDFENEDVPPDPHDRNAFVRQNYVRDGMNKRRELINLYFE